MTEMRLFGLMRATIEQVVGLFVDDGLIASGGLAALFVTYLLGQVRPPVLPPGTLGFVLFGLVAAILLASLLRAGQAARRD